MPIFRRSRRPENTWRPRPARPRPSPGIKIVPERAEGGPAAETRVPREPAEPRPYEPEPEPGELLGVFGRFDAPERALGCWSALRDALDDRGSARRPDGYRAPDGTVWVTAELPPAAGAGLIWAAGGEAYAYGPGRRTLRPLGGAAHPPPDLDKLETWPSAGVLELMAGSAPRTPRDAAFGVVMVLTAGRLAHQVIRRCLAEGADVVYEPVERADLLGTRRGPAVLMEVTAGDLLPRSLVRRLSRLPYTIVARLADQRGGLLIDVGFAPPIDDAVVAAEVPHGQRWVIGRPEEGWWSVASTGRRVRADGMLTAPTLPLTPAPADPGPRRVVPASIPVDLVPSIRHAGTADAVLLDDEDLDRLRRFLLGRPLAEEAFLFLGPGVHLLAEPVHLANRVPFGLPLRRIGPGGLYIAADHALRPPLSPSARAALFRVRRGRVVAVRPGGAVEFRTEDAVPAWSLWLPEDPPEFAAGVSARGRDLLTRLEKVEDAARSVPPGLGDDDDAPVRRGELRRSAVRAEMDGDLPLAARLLEEAGDLARAARAFERAARAEDGE